MGSSKDSSVVESSSSAEDNEKQQLDHIDRRCKCSFVCVLFCVLVVALVSYFIYQSCTHDPCWNALIPAYTAIKPHDAEEKTKAFDWWESLIRSGEIPDKLKDKISKELDGKEETFVKCMRKESHQLVAEAFTFYASPKGLAYVLSGKNTTELVAEIKRGCDKLSYPKDGWAFTKLCAEFVVNLEGELWSSGNIEWMREKGVIPEIAEDESEKFANAIGAGKIKELYKVGEDNRDVGLTHFSEIIGAGVGKGIHELSHRFKFKLKVEE